MPRAYVLREIRRERIAPRQSGNAHGPEPVSPSPKQPLTSPAPKPTAPFKWPPHVSREVAFSANNPGVWLNPHNHHSIPLSGRGPEEELLDDFINRDRLFLIVGLIAPSGAGKIRLVSEWMRDYMAKDAGSEWDAGFVEGREHGPWRDWTPTRNTLIIVDYTYNYGAVMSAIIDRFKGHASHKIRLLVLDHVLPDKLHEDFAWKHSVPNQGVLDSENGLFFQPIPIVLEPETDESALLRDVIAAADPFTPPEEKRRYDRDSEVVVKAANALMAIGVEDQETPTADDIRGRDAIRHPLFAVLMGQMIYQDDNPEFSGLTRRHLITYYFERARRLPWIDDPDNPYAETLGPWVGCYVSAATLLRGLRESEILDHLPENVRKGIGNEFDAFMQFCNRIVSGDDDQRIKPFEPDILGESFLLKFVHNYRPNPEMLETFAKVLSTHSSPVHEEKAANFFLETLQRLVRNLINDDQNDPAVKDSWGHCTNSSRQNATR